MIQTIPDPAILSGATSFASQTAQANATANVAAIRATQSRLVDALQTRRADEADWVFARDGSLTAMDIAGRWWAGCSLPARAAQFMFEKADLSGAVVCMLTPVHAAQIRVALDQMRASQAILVLMPDFAALAVLLGCEDFSEDIKFHRLYFAWGEGWETELDLLLEENPGLPTPTMFARPVLADSSSADALMAPAQKMFADHVARRAEKARAIRCAWRGLSLRKICVVAPLHFRLWDDAGSALGAAVGDGIDGIESLRFDSDDPASASPLALAIAAAQCDAIVTPNLCRADLPDLAPDDMPWATWVTMPRIPAATKAGKRDVLLVAEPTWKNLAIEKGWDASRVFVAGWPSNETASTGDPYLAIISDTRPLDPPPNVTEYSSHRLLWESIQNQLLNDPWQAGESAERYLTEQILEAGLESASLDRTAFLDGVIKHAYQQGIAAMLLNEKIPLRIYGQGWDQLDGFIANAMGPIESRRQRNQAAASARALVFVSSSPGAHPIEALGKPVIRGHRCRDTFLSDVRLALAGQFPIPIHSGALLSAELLVAALSMDAGVRSTQTGERPRPAPAE